MSPWKLIFYEALDRELPGMKERYHKTYGYAYIHQPSPQKKVKYEQLFSRGLNGIILKKYSTMGKEYEMSKDFQFLIYQTAEEDVSVNAVIKDETIWLSQKAMAELFDCSTDN